MIKHHKHQLTINDKIKFKRTCPYSISDLQSEQIAINYKTIPYYFRFSWTPCYRCKTCKKWEIILPLYLALVGPLLENNIQIGAPQFKNDMEKLEMVQGEQREWLKGWKKWTYEERLRTLESGLKSSSYSTSRTEYILFLWKTNSKTSEYEQSNCPFLTYCYLYPYSERHRKSFFVKNEKNTVFQTNWFNSVLLLIPIRFSKKPLTYLTEKKKKRKVVTVTTGIFNFNLYCHVSLPFF